LCNPHIRTNPLNDDIDAFLAMIVDLAEQVVDRVCATLGIESFAIPDGAIETLPIDMEEYLDAAGIESLEEPQILEALIDAMAVLIAERARVALADPEPHYGLWADDNLIESPLTCAEAVAKRGILAQAAEIAGQDTAYRVYALGDEFPAQRIAGERGLDLPDE
jgi:hypothetical protein